MLLKVLKVDSILFESRYGKDLEMCVLSRNQIVLFDGVHEELILTCLGTDQVNDAQN